MNCPHCRVEMMAPPEGVAQHHQCPQCPRVAAPGETANEIETRESNRLNAIAMLDTALILRGVPIPANKGGTTMGQQIETRGCSACGGTQWKTIDTDDDGNPTSETTWVCGSCGHMGD